MSGRIIATLAALLIGAAAYAQTLVIYPFSSGDSFLGAAVADRLAVALEGEAEVYGPAVAPSLIPPLPVGEGYLNPTEFLRGAGVANRVGTELLRSALDADAVVTGVIAFEGEQLVARMLLASEDGIDSYLVRSSADDPSGLSARVVAATARRLNVSVPERDDELDLSASDGDLAQALTLIAAGLVDDARRLLERVEEPAARSEELLAAIRELERGGDAADPALLATLAVNRQPLDERLALRYFERLARTSELPAAELWVAVLESSLNDLASAEEHFAQLPRDFAYGQAAWASYLAGGGGEGVQAPLERALESGEVAALIGVLSLATSTEDIELEKDALTRLTRQAPFFSYPFERLSFIAFDEDDPLAAARALAVAVELEPESDLYWTNLGWAYYLLGLLEQSENASLRAVAIEPRQYIAQYNLGLVQAVTGRLALATETYRLALRLDPEVDDAAVDDLEQALELYPGEPAVHYVLALLYEAEGRRAEAAEQFSRYAERTEGGEFRGRAVERVEVLTAPPPPIELSAGLVEVGLGTRDYAAAPFHPGDPLFPSFEVYTPGEELPQRIEVVMSLVDPDGEATMTVERTVDIPRGAIGFVVDDVELGLPLDLSPGVYRIDVDVRADEGREAAGSVMFEVGGEPQLIRRLLGRNLMMQALDTGIRLYGADDLARPELLTEVLLRELRAGADVAEEALPEVEEGRFAGMTGRSLFNSSSEADVVAFLEYLLASGARDTSFVFAEAYAQWALDGAPLAAEVEEAE